MLVIDDERPALDELAWLLSSDPRVGEVLTADSATEALRLLQDLEVDAVFLDIQMPGLTGLELAQVLSRFKTPPPIVFVTAHEEHAVDAFELHAVDYVLKPVRAERLAEAVRRVSRRAGHAAEPATTSRSPVERGGVTRFINRSDIRYVEAQGDYARLHTADGSPPRAQAADPAGGEWADAGFVRIHRSLLVALAHVDEVDRRAAAARCVVGGRRPAGQPPAHPRAARAARPAATDPVEPSDDPRARPSRRPSGSGSPARAPSGARHRRPRSREIDAQTELGEIYMRSLLRAQLRLALRRAARARCYLGGAAAAVPRSSRARRRARARHAAAWLVLGVLVYPLLRRSSAGATSGGPSATSATSPTSSSATVDDRERTALRRRRGRPGHGRHAGDRHLGAAVLAAPPATSSSPRGRCGPGLNASAIGGEYLSAASFLGVAGLVLAFGADMLWYPVGWTAGYLVLLVLVAAPLRRSGAYTLPDFAEARLELARACAALARCWWCDRLALPDAAAPGRRAGPRARPPAPPPWAARRSSRSSCWSTCCPAGCAASRSCRPSSTG